MANNCLDNKLHNDSGTSQAQRVLNALSASYAKVDERSTADLLLFAKKYGAFLNYYDATNTIAGNWSDFMAKDISVIIASVKVWNTIDYIPYINTLYDCIHTPVAPYDTPATTFKYVFDLVFSLAEKLNTALLQLPADADYTSFLNAAIASKLAIPVNQLSGYYTYFVANGLISAGASAADPLSPLDDTMAVPSNTADFQSMFSFFTSAPWVLPPGVIIPLADIMAGDGLEDIVTNNFFTGAATSFLNGIINIVNQTGAYLDKTLTGYPAHTPHYALYLAFLRLFKFAQDHLNKYTERHLEFYYKKVLQLNNNPGLADTVHLVFTLQKSPDQYLLKKGTKFKAGKDAGGNDLFYSIADDIVLNQATVQAIKSLYLVKQYNNGNKIIPQQLFASPKANSADGQGGKLTAADQSWQAFRDLSNPGFKSAGNAAIGFAIASNALYLNEGTRTITITFNCEQVGSLAGVDLNGIFSAKFTGNKKWFDAADYPPGNSTDHIVITPDAVKKQLSITITLNGSAPPVIPYSQKIHGGNFTQALPMVQLTVADYAGYAAIKALVIISIDITVVVDAIKNLSLQNDDGKIDATKPFKPLGDFPDDGASFIIGSKEIFQKKLASLQLSFNWQAAPVYGTTVNAIALSAGQWAATPFDAAAALGSTVQLSGFENIIPQSVPDFTANENYAVTSVDGFIKLQLISPSHYYSLSTYLASISSATTTTVTATTVSGTETSYSVTQPTPPPTPQLIVAQSLSIAYTANETIAFDETTVISFNNRSDFFYHIEPFGFREMHPFLFKTPAETDVSLADNSLRLLPVFNLDNGLQSSADTGKPSGPDNGGELWIGLNNTKPGEAQSILFQLSEGSSNPLKAAASVSWFYMSSNHWIAFDAITEVNDETNNLSQSGLIIFNLPGDETIDNSRTDINLLWIKAVVSGNTDAICKIIAVMANAAKAQFVTDIAGGIYFTQNIAAGTVSKPAIANAALKLTSQPYPSFGGRPKESNPQFDQRVSERLRHKNRAVTSWDYERLVLQHFPQVHKVKCLSHTSLQQQTQDYSELKPGDVMIVTIPDLSLVTGANPLLPFTSVGLLTDIEKYIKPLCSPFVHLHVCNPQFEAVQFNFNVYFINNNSNSSYYSQQLNSDLQQYLMPWAFGSAAADIEFGGKIEKSVVLAFVQDRPYVDFVTCFKMYQYVFREDGTFSLLSSDIEEAVATTARSVLVPYIDPLTGVGNNIHPSANCSCNGQ